MTDTGPVPAPTDYGTFAHREVLEVFAAATDRWGPATPAVVCTDGQPSAAVQTLLAQLVEAPETFEAWLSRIPIGRLANPAEVANTTAFLLSELASAMTANVVRVDGGYGER